MTTKWVITSNDDDSVTLEFATVTARIEADSWKEANEGAGLLCAVMQAKDAYRQNVRKIEAITRSMGRLHGELDTLLHNAREQLANTLDMSERAE